MSGQIPSDYATKRGFERTVAKKVNPVLQGYVWNQYATAPSPVPYEGYSYYDTALHMPGWYNGTNWEYFVGTGQFRSVTQHGAVPNSSGASATNAAAFQEAVDAAYAAGGGFVFVPPGTWYIGPTTDTTTYEVGGVYQQASSTTEGCMIVLKPGVTLLGAGVRVTVLQASQTGISGIFGLSPDSGGVRDLTVKGVWDVGETSYGRSGFVSVFPSDAALTNLVSPGTFTGTTESWQVDGDITLSSVSGRLRATYGATGGGFIYKSFATTIGQQYRVACSYTGGTNTIPLQTEQVHISTSASDADRYYSQLVGNPISTNFRKTFTFTATSTTTYIHIGSSEPVDANLIGDQFEIDDISIAQFSTVNQAIVFNDFWIERVKVSNWESYGIGYQDGDQTGSGLHMVHIADCGADGFDSKQRNGPTLSHYGLVLDKILVERVAQRVTGQAGIDFHGIGQVSNVTIKDIGASGFETQGLRFRTMDASATITYEGDQARGCMASNIRVIGNNEGTGSGIQIGNPDCSVVNAYVQDCYDGISIVGNTYGSAERSSVSNAVVRDAGQYSFVTSASGSVLTACRSLDATTAGFRNTATEVTYIDCDDEGSPLKEAHTIVPLRIGGFGETGAGMQVTQATSKSTSVTATERRGRIVTHDANLVAGTSVTFRVNLSGVTFPSTDIVLVQSASSGHAVSANRNVTDSSFDIVLTNVTGGDLAVAVNINYRIIEGGTNA